jgi:hypothetical protein
MYLTIFISAISMLLSALYLRGGVLHNYLTQEVGSVFQQVGFQVSYEYPVKLDNGQLNFLDLMVERGDCKICIEIETSARHVIDNAVKAEQTNLPLWIVVPNAKTQKAVMKKLADTQLQPGGLKIYILLLGKLKQQVMNCFSLITTANKGTENK